MNELTRATAWDLPSGAKVKKEGALVVEPVNPVPEGPTSTGKPGGSIWAGGMKKPASLSGSSSGSKGGKQVSK